MKLVKLLLVLVYVTYHVAGSTEGFRGDLAAIGPGAVFPGDATYDQVTGAYNKRLTIRPAAVTFPSTPQQVAKIVKVGGKYNHQVVARSGGHSYVANGLGGKNGLVIVDLRNMTHIDVSSSSGIATIQTGNRLGDVALALNQKGRGIPHGSCPYVGIGGHAVHGGWGFASRMWGLTLDTIQAIDVVTADGTIETISNSNKADLFWAMKGAGSSFGIATAITVKSYPVPTTTISYTYNWNLKASDAAKAISESQRFSQTNIPKELSLELTFGKGNSAGFVDLTLSGGWYGPISKLDSVLAPYLTKLPKPEWSNRKVGSYIDVLSYQGGSGTLDVHHKLDVTDTFYVKSLMTPEASPISDKALNAFTTYLAYQGFSSNLNWFVQMELYGGKNSVLNSVPVDATAFARRNALWTFQFYASSPNYNPPFPSSGFSFLDNMVNSITSNSPSNWDIGAYTNYIDDRLSNWQHMYYGSHYQRLKSIKRIYDPRNTFSFPQSIEL